MEMASDKVIWGLGLTLLAGLSTGIGSCIAFLCRKPGTRFLSISLGFSGGVMIYISLVELLAAARHTLIGLYGQPYGSFYATTAFFVGIAIAMLIDKAIPSYENPHEVRKADEMDNPVHHDRLYRSGLLFALAIGIHNFPEGVAVFVAGLGDRTAAISIALAIAVHNIPEGITVSVPIYRATGSRRKAFMWSLLSGLAEPIGAIIAWLVLMPFLTPTVMTLTFALVAGIMVFISFDELIPLAEEYGEHHLVIYGLVSGMLVMALTLAF